MPFVSRPMEPAPQFWASVTQLLDARRWSDAVVTVRAVADRYQQTEIRLTLGTLLYERGQRHHAVREWTDVIELANVRGEWSVSAAAHHNLAAMYRDLGDYRLARIFQQRCTSLLGDCGPEELLQLGNDAVAAERWELAESLYQAAGHLVDEEDPLHADLTATHGLFAAFQGEPRIGLRWLQQAYKQHVAANDDQHAGKDLFNAAALFEQLGRFGWARVCLDRAIHHFTAAGDTAWLQAVECAVGRLDQTRRRTAFNPQWN